MGYRNWLSGEPNNYLGYQNCLAIKRRLPNRRSYGWFDDDCYQKKFYICERRGWYCWGRYCSGLYSDLAKAVMPRGEAKRRRIAQPSATAAPMEKVAFES